MYIPIIKVFFYYCFSLEEMIAAHCDWYWSKVSPHEVWPAQRSCALRSDPVWTTLLHIAQPHLVCPQSPGTCFAWRTGCTQGNRGFLPLIFLKQSKTHEFPHYKYPLFLSVCKAQATTKEVSVPNTEPCKNCFRPLDSLVPWGILVSPWTPGSVRFCHVP